MTKEGKRAGLRHGPYQPLGIPACRGLAQQKLNYSKAPGLNGRALCFASSAVQLEGKKFLCVVVQDLLFVFGRDVSTIPEAFKALRELAVPVRYV